MNKGERPGAAVSRAPWVLAAAGPALLAATYLWGRPGLADGAALDEVYPNLVFGSLLPLLGALILSRLPGHPVGRLYLACGLASALTLAVYVYAQAGLVLHPGSLPGALAAGWASSFVWTLGFAPLATLGILLFPDGRPPGPRWRPLAWVAVAAVALMAVSNALAPGPLANHPVADNPLGLPLPHSWFVAAGSVGFGLLVVGMLGSAASAVVRWRRAAGEDRAALSWFAFAAVVLVGTVMLPASGLLGVAMTLVAVPLLPIAAGVAVLRGRLYGIEVAARGTLVYVALTSTLLLGYGGAVVLLGEVFRGHAGPAASLVATAAVAVAFSPLRTRLQRAADRLVYGERHDPYAVLAGVGRRIDDPAPVDEGALGDIAEAVATSLRLPYVRVEVRRPTDDVAMVAAWGEPVDDLHVVPLSFRTEPVGTILAAPRGPGVRFRAEDVQLLDDVGRHVGAAAHAMLLSRDLQRSREGLVTAREEERRRLRRDLHDGLGPALAGIALGLDAVARLVPEQPEEAVLLTGALKAEMQTSIADVRRLVEDLRPPALDQLGLVRALEQHAARLNERDPRLEVSVEADVAVPLPAAVEVAAYRILTEALNNVAKHAGASHASVRLAVGRGSTLLLRVEDDGRGIDTGTPGVGMTAMRERATELGGTCEASPAPDGGTCVAARIPLVTP